MKAVPVELLCGVTDTSALLPTQALVIFPGQKDN